MIVKSLQIKNTGTKTFRIDRVVNEILGLVEDESALDNSHTLNVGFLNGRITQVVEIRTSRGWVTGCGRTGRVLVEREADPHVGVRDASATDAARVGRAEALDPATAKRIVTMTAPGAAEPKSGSPKP